MGATTILGAIKDVCAPSYQKFGNLIDRISQKVDQGINYNSDLSQLDIQNAFDKLESNLEQKAKNTAEYFKYTGWTYADVVLSAPLLVARNAYRIKEEFDRTLSIHPLTTTSWEDVRKYTPGYNLREKIREKKDTKPGSIYLRSNAIGSIFFLGTGMPAAELAQWGIRALFPDLSPETQHGLNTGTTLACQYIIPTGAFILSDVLHHPGKYTVQSPKPGDQDEPSKAVNWKAVGKNLAGLTKAGIYFDTVFVPFKGWAQTALLNQGITPALTSALPDILGIAAWYTVTIQLGCSQNLIAAKTIPHPKAKTSSSLSP
jgi:hypothetical protein